MQSTDTITTGKTAMVRHLYGSSQTGVRLYNERLVLSLIRAHGSLSKAEIARLTRLSPQTVSVIVRQLEADGLLLKGDAVKGKVGQPLQPFSLNPEGAFAVGLKVGRRSGDMVLVGLDGTVRQAIHHPYQFPTPTEFIAFAEDAFRTLTHSLSPVLRKCISGLGIAMPFEIWKWEEEAGAPRSTLDAWQGFDLTAEIARICDWPVLPCNDATAACAAEQLFGIGRDLRDFAYFYVGYFIGGGLVLNGHLHTGPSGNAAAFGSIPVPSPSKAGVSVQLIRSASLYLLERDLRAAGLEESLLWMNADDWSAAGPVLERWIATAADALAEASVAVASVIEPSAIVIDGAIPPHVREGLVDAVRKRLQTLNVDGISPFEVLAGSVGVNARALGAASLPLFANFMVDRDILFKEE